MSSVGPVVVSKLTRTLYSVLRTDRVSDRPGVDGKKNARPDIIGQAVCIETAVAVTLVGYLSWICFRGWFFKEPVITSDHMIMISLLILVAALGAKLVWIAWSTIYSLLKH